jgi:excisionase family DNA binding protein
MRIGLDLPPELIESLVAKVAERVLADLGADATGHGTSSPYMTIPEAATYLRCPRQRIDDLLSQRRLTRIKEGRRTLVARAEIETHLVRHDRRREA